MEGEGGGLNRALEVREFVLLKGQVACAAIVCCAEVYQGDLQASSEAALIGSKSVLRAFIISLRKDIKTFATSSG